MAAVKMNSKETRGEMKRLEARTVKFHFESINLALGGLFHADDRASDVDAMIAAEPGSPGADIDEQSNSEIEHDEASEPQVDHTATAALWYEQMRQYENIQLLAP